MGTTEHGGGASGACHGAAAFPARQSGGRRRNDPRGRGRRRSHTLKPGWAAAVFAFSVGCTSLNPASLYRQAELELQHGDLRLALENAERGLRRFGSDLNWHWKFRLLKGEILLTNRPAQEAAAFLEREAVPESVARELKARHLTDLGYAYFRLASPAKARQFIEEAYRLASDCGAAALIPVIEQRRGVLHNDFESADACFRKAFEKAEERQDLFLRASALNNLGWNRLRHLRFDEAIPYFLRARQDAERFGAKRILEASLGNLGWCYYKIGDFPQGLDVLARADGLAEQLEDNDFRQRWLNTIGLIHAQLQDFQKAVEWEQRAVEVARKAHNQQWLAIALTNLAQISLFKGDLDSAEKANAEALEIKRRTPDRRSLAYCTLNAALIAARRGRHAEAEAGFREVVRAGRELKDPDLEWIASGGLASVLRAAGRRADAEGQYRSAIATVDREWKRLGRDEFRVMFLARLIQFYQNYVSFLLSTGQPEKALEIADSSRARLLSRRLENRGALPAKLELSRLPEAVRAGRTSVLVYWLAPQRSSLWLIGAKGVSHFDLPGEQVLNRLVERYTALILGGYDPLQRKDALAGELTQAVLGPALHLIPENSNVIVVPDGRLHELNFETLVIGGNRYWITDVTISVAPALGILRQDCQAARHTRALLIGDPEPPSPEFPRLPQMRTEMEMLARLFPEHSAFRGSGACPERYREARPQDFTHIHFAAHGTANRDSPLDSAVILSRRGDEFKLYARDVLDLPLRADLVTISACRSAVSKAYAGEGLMGFTWAFLQAGARHVIGGIWDVDAAAGAQIMERLYHGLAAQQTPAAALRHAKLALVRQKFPYYWGALQVYTRCAP